MHVREERAGDVVVWTPYGDMDLTAVPTLEARLQRLLDDGTRSLLWDLGSIGLLPSTAAGFLLQAARRLHEAGGRMVLVCDAARVLGTLRTMGVLELFRTYRTRDEALASF